MAEESKQIEQAQAEAAAPQANLLDEIVQATRLKPSDEGYSITKQGVQAYIDELLKPGQEGVLITQGLVDDYIAHEWSFIPHFYRDFYVFQYATSFTAAEALSSKVLAGDAAAREKYLTFLGSGGSKYPIDLLKARG